MHLLVLLLYDSRLRGLSEYLKWQLALVVHYKKCNESMREKNEASHWAGWIWHMELHVKNNLQKPLDRETKYNMQKTK